MSSSSASKYKDNEFEKITSAYNMDDIIRILADKGLVFERVDNLPSIAFHVYDTTTRNEVGLCNMRYIRHILQITLLLVREDYRRSGICVHYWYKRLLTRQLV